MLVTCNVHNVVKRVNDNTEYLIPNRRIVPVKELIQEPYRLIFNTIKCIPYKIKGNIEVSLRGKTYNTNI